MRAKSFGLTYVPWNLHKPKLVKLIFEGIAGIIPFLKLCYKLDFLVMLLAGPYICASQA